MRPPLFFRLAERKVAAAAVEKKTPGASNPTHFGVEFGPRRGAPARDCDVKSQSKRWARAPIRGNFWPSARDESASVRRRVQDWFDQRFPAAPLCRPRIGFPTTARQR